MGMVQPPQHAAFTLRHFTLRRPQYVGLAVLGEMGQCGNEEQTEQRIPARPGLPKPKPPTEVPAFAHLLFYVFVHMTVHLFVHLLVQCSEVSSVIILGLDNGWQ